MKAVFLIIIVIHFFIFPNYTNGQTPEDENISLLGNATIALNNATNTLAEVASNLSKNPKIAPIKPVDTNIVVTSIFSEGLPVMFLSVIAFSMVIPLVIDLILGHLKRPRLSTNNQNDGPTGMPQLYRTLMTFGIILLVGTIIFYLLALITLSDINSPNPPNAVLQSLIDVLKNLSTILGTALATIVAFYFGMRGAESAAEKAQSRAQSPKPENNETPKPENEE